MLLDKKKCRLVLKQPPYLAFFRSNFSELILRRKVLIGNFPLRIGEDYTAVFNPIIMF